MWKSFNKNQALSIDSVVAVSGAATSLVGLLGLGAWITGLRFLASIRSDYMPISPDSAMAFVVLGLILFFHVRNQDRGETKLLASAVIAFVSIYGLLKSIEYFINADLTFENILFPSTEKIGSFFVKRMSPVTGVLFLFSGIALQLKLLWGADHKISNVIGSLGVITLTAGFVATTGYAFGTPLLYGSEIIPLAATTAIGFFLLGFGLVAMAGPENIFVHPFVGNSSSARLLRIFLPVTITGVLVQGFLSDTITTKYGINHTAADALFSLAFATFMCGVVVQLSRVMFLHADRAETERRRAEEVSIRLASIVESSDNAIIGEDLHSIITSWNAGAEKLFGYSTTESVGRSIMQIVPQDRVIEEEQILGRVKHNERIPDLETVRLTKDRQLIHVSVTVSPIRNAAGKIVGASMIARDITGRKEAEEALRASESDFRELWGATVEGIVIHDRGIVLEVNDAVCRVFGYPREQVIGKTLFDFTTTENHELLRQRLASRSKEGYEISALRADGAKITLEIFAKDILFHGKPRRMVAIRDITEGKKAEEALRESESRFHALIEQAPVAIMVSRNDVGMYVNQKFGQLFGLKSIDDAVGQPIMEYYALKSRQEREERNRRRLAGNPISSEFEFVGLRVDGSEFPAHVTVAPIQLQDGGAHIGFITDFTERKQTEVALRASEERFRSLYENSTIGLYRTSPDGTIILANPTLVRKLGYSSFEELAARNLGKEGFEPSYDRKQFIKEIEKAGEVNGLEASWTRKDGSVINIRESARAIRDENGIVLSYDGTVEDITERKKAEEALRESESKLRAILDNSHDAIGVHVNGIWVLCNPAAVRLFKVSSPADLVGTSILNVIAPDERARITDFVKKREEGVVTPSLYQTRGLRNDSTEFDMDVALSSFRLDNNLYVLVILRDVTEQKRSEQALLASETRFRQLSNSTFEAVAIHDNGILLDVNESFCRMYGIQYAEALGMSALELTAPESRDLLLERIRTSDDKPYEGIALRKDGTKFAVELAGRPIRYEGRDVRVAAIRDITERKRADLERQAIYEIVEGATTSTNLNELLKLVHRSLKKVLYAENCFVALHDSHTGLFSFPYYVDKIDPPPEPSALRKSCTSYVFRTGKPHLISQVVFEQLREQNEVELVGSRSPSWIGVPLHTPAETIGVLVLQHYEKKNIYSERDLNFLATVGSEVALVIERKLAEEALRESEERMRAIVEGTPHLFFYTQDAEANTAYVSPTVEQITGYKADTWLKRKDWFVTDAQINQSAKEKTYAHLQGEFVQEPILIEVRHANGDPILLEAYEYPIMHNGKVIGLQGVAHDITERKKAEEALRESESRFRQLAEAAVEGIAISQKGIFVDGNARLAAMLGYELGEMIGKPVADFIAPDSRALVLLHMSGNYEGQYEHFLLRKDGSTFPVESHAHSMIWRGKKTRVTVLLDVSERKRAEEQLQKLSLAVDQSPASIVITDTKGNIEYVNPKFTQVTGYTLEEAVGKNPRILKSGETSPEEYKRLWEMITSGEAWRGEFHNKKKNGELFWEMASISPVKNNDNVVTNFVAVKEDITQRKRLEEHFQQAQKMESIGTLAGGIAHDFNNILGIILGHSALLDRRKENPQKLSESIKAIIRASERGSGLVKQLLTFARKTDTFFESVSVNDMIREINKLLNETFPKTITISMSLQQDLPAIVSDAGQIHQVLLNLCVNARDAMSKGGVLSISSRTVEGETVSSRFSKATARQYVQIEIADNGIGMDEATLQRIFEPFFTTKGPGKGTGLGLAVVFGIVEHSGGFIDVRSAPGEGSAFTLYFPIPERALEETQRAIKSAEVIAGGSETILVIEDEEMLRSLTKAILISKGYTVLTAKDGQRGLEMYQSHQKEIAVVLSDIGLPAVSGLDVLKRIRELNPKAKVVLASGFIDPSTKSEMYKSGAKHFIQKPYLPDEVLQAIREVIDSNLE